MTQTSPHSLHTPIPIAGTLTRVDMNRHYPINPPQCSMSYQHVFYSGIVHCVPVSDGLDEIRWQIFGRWWPGRFPSFHTVSSTQNIVILSLIVRILSVDPGHSLIDANLQQSCTHGLMGPWATLWSSRTDEAMDWIETGYGPLVCGMLHHMVMEPQLHLQEICLRLDEHVAASTSNVADESNPAAIWMRVSNVPTTWFGFLEVSFIQR